MSTFLSKEGQKISARLEQHFHSQLLPTKTPVSVEQ